MQDHALRGTLIENSKDLGPGVSNVDHERKVVGLRERPLRGERAFLLRPGRPHPEEVEAALADGDHAWMREQLLDLGARPGVEALASWGCIPAVA